jgi:hypothetical protein
LDESFYMRSARSGPFLAALAMIVAVETGAFHLLLVHRFPLVAWILTASSVSLLLWLVADYAAMGRTAVRVDPNRLVARIGRRALLTVPWGQVASAAALSWRDTAGPRGSYLNATKPATPNVLIAFREPVEARIFGMRRPIEKLALHLDRPDGFVEALERLRAEASPDDSPAAEKP